MRDCRGVDIAVKMSLLIACSVVILTLLTPIGAADSQPNASFSYSPSTPNPDDPITLDASSSSDPDGEIVSYKWDTDGDGTYSEYSQDADDGQTSSVSFNTGGTYTVGLKVEDEAGNTDTVTKQITVENPAPDASFSYSPSTPNPDDSITLDASDSSDPDGEIVSTKWDSDGDGTYSEYSQDASDGQTSSVSFNTGGTYTVGLKIKDNGGKTDTITKQITVENPEPSASFSYSPSTPNPDDSITLDASASSDPDGEIVSYKWDTDGDGTYSEYSQDANDGQTSSVSFNTGGTYTVRLKVKDNGGKTDTVTKQITVENPAPDASFSYSPSTPNPDDTITLDASSSSDRDGEIVSYKWDSDGDGTYSEYSQDANDGQTSSVSFRQEGTYTVRLKIKDNGGNTDTITKQITVENPEPTAEFSYTITDSDDIEVNLDGSASSDPDGEIVDYEWYVGGQYITSDESTSLRFREKGSHEVRLVVTDNGGAESSVTKEITVSAPPEAKITAPDVPVAVLHEVEFSAESSRDTDGSIDSYEWEFSDGTTASGEEAKKEFKTPGSYDVRLVVRDDSGQTGSSEVTIQVKRPPEIDVSWGPEDPIDDERVQFNASSDSSISTWRWDFDGDGRYEETGQSVEHAFPDGGEKEVQVTIVRSDGLEASYRETLSVREVDPQAEITWTPSTPRTGFPVEFRANTSDTIQEFEWDFDEDGQLDAEGQKVTHVFGTVQESEVSVTVIDDHGDEATYTETVSVEPGLKFSTDTSNVSLELGDEIWINFEITNDHPEHPVELQLDFGLANGSSSISQVDGLELSGQHRTQSFSVEPGESRQISVKFKPERSGVHTISAIAEYDTGKSSNGNQTARFDTIEVDIESPVLGIGLPTLGGVVGVSLILSLALYARFM